MPADFDIQVDADTTVTGCVYLAKEAKEAKEDGPNGRSNATLVLAHGAGAPQTHPFMTRFANGLAHRGLDVATFNFVYMQRQRRIPDPAPRLEACYRAVIDATRARVASATTRLMVGGKSMGGRIASQVVAEDNGDLGVAGLVLLGYPLHPPGRPEKRRDAHLIDIEAPMLFVQGSRDPFGTEAELRPVVEACRDAHLYVVEGGDHSFKVRRKDPTPQEEVYEEAMNAIARFVLTPTSSV